MAIIDHAVYATQPHPLDQQITKHLHAANPDPIDGEIYALIVPDSNRLQGGTVAAEAYKLLKGRAYDTVVLIAPSHTGTFQRMNICSVNTYVTPLGSLAVNDRIRHELCDEDDDIFVDDSGHFHTDGIDVQLPYLQTVLDEFDIVPVVMGEESPAFCRELGHAIGEITYNRRALVVASADVIDASEEDMAVFREAFEQADVSRLMMVLNGGRLEIEGKGPLLVALIAALHRRASNVQVLAMEPSERNTPGAIGAVLWR
ncbi:MAG TPA: AmmeMemoRadiSam system protein B [Rhodothermales bacterium]|nr:AmmeMemoRadiSam system protein B [Rhodothermales bacterium]